MKALMLGACLAASAVAIWGGAPALAQPSDQGGDQRDPYYDQPPPLTQAPQPPALPQPAAPSGPSAEGGYQSDRGHGQYQAPAPPPAGQPSFQAYQGAGGYAPPAQVYAPDARDYDLGRAYRVYGARPDRWSDPYRSGPTWRYTGRVGQAWRNDEGQYCVWRQRTWVLPNGRSLYQWIPSCDD